MSSALAQSYRAQADRLRVLATCVRWRRRLRGQRHDRRALLQELNPGEDHLVAGTQSGLHRIDIANRLAQRDRYLVRCVSVALWRGDIHKCLSADPGDCEHRHRRRWRCAPGDARIHDLAIAQALATTSESAPWPGFPADRCPPAATQNRCCYAPAPCRSRRADPRQAHLRPGRPARSERRCTPRGLRSHPLWSVGVVAET